MNIHAREEWRRHNIFTEVSDVYLAGLGWRVYLYALGILRQRYLERSFAMEKLDIGE